MSRGRVVLVGAGPGAPDLITLRGLRALESADVVVYDALASSELLDLAPATAQRINVGKRGHDAPTLPQTETTALLVRLAGEGKHVVRLKGGDPYVFGRGSEEAEACAEAGIPFEVVPGVSSIFGALAYAGIPITDRRHAASFAVVTGHKDPTKVAEETRWEGLAQSADTLLILMGMRNLAEIAQRLLAGGRAPETPAAAVMHGTLPHQRVVEAPLSRLADAVREAGLGAPAVIVVGDVVRLRPALAWFENQPLFGKRVLVTRAADQAVELCHALQSVGAETVVRPMLALLPPVDPAPLDRALGRLAEFDALVFTSANAVRFTADRARERGVTLAEFSGAVYCVGPKTAAAADAVGLRGFATPAGRFDAEGVLAEIARVASPEGQRFLVPHSALARDVLPEGLRAAGGEVEAVIAYRNEPAEIDVAALRAELVGGRLDVLTFTSPSIVRRFREALDAPALAAAQRCCIAAIGPVTARALESADLAPDVQAAQAGALPLVEAIAQAMAARGESG